MAVLMSAQGAAMAAETSTEAVTKEIQTEQQEEPASEITEVELASAQDEENELPENTTQVEQEKLQEAESQTEIESEMQISSDTEIESEMQTQMKTENESQTQSELESEVTEELEPSTSLMDEAALQIERPEEIADGWHQDENGNRFYAKNGEYVRECVIEIDGLYYGFGWNGVMYVNQGFSISNYETHTSISYRAKEDGSLYVNEWFDKYYHYGENGIASSGVQEIDGKLYVFEESGHMYTYEAVAVEGGECYYCDGDGIATKMQNNEWFQTSIGYLYVKDGVVLKNCVEKIGDNWYGFMFDGRRYTDEEFSAYDKETGKNNFYRAKEDGTLCVNEWYNWYSDRHYYYGNEGKAYSGFQEVDGMRYYFSESGERCQNMSITVDGKNYYCKSDGTIIEFQGSGWIEMDGNYLYAKDGEILKNCVEQIEGKWYGFNQKGIVYIGTEFSIWDEETYTTDYYRAKQDGTLYVNEWYQVSADSDTYYYGEGGKAYSGLQTIDRKQYYFTDGRIRKNLCILINGSNYYCDEDGVVTLLQNEGWNKVGENYLYIKEGNYVYNCIMWIDGNYYGFDSTGIMYANTIFSMSDSGFRYHSYWASPSGALYTNKWYYETNKNSTEIYYYGADGQQCTGLQTIDGIQYIFDANGTLAVSRAVSLGEDNYYCDAEGAVHEMPNNEWYKGDNGSWYYVKDGRMAQGCSIQVNGKWYSFDNLGKMRTEDLNIDENGALLMNTWSYDGTYWYYYGSDGNPYTNGIYEISGANYYFDVNKRMARSEICTYNGVCYKADANGYLTPITEDGWILLDGAYYYIENNQLIKDKACKINGVWYGFDYNGKMCTNDTFNVFYRAKSDGSLYCSEWYQDNDGSWYYYDENAKCVTGTVQIQNTMYVFDDNGILKTSSAVQTGIDYKLADQNGVWVQTPGWILMDGGWYYVKENGSLYTGILKENGYTYYLNPEMMQSVNLTEIDGIAYQIDANGHATTATDGVYRKEVSGDLYYVSDGKTAKKGWKEIDGKQYYFAKTDSDGMYYAVRGTDYRIDGKIYRFNMDGTLAAPGWELSNDGNWYYISEAGTLTTEDALINGVLYHFGKDGRLQVGAVAENGVCKLYSDDGTLLETGNAQGWSLLGGSYYYLSGNELIKEKGVRLEDGKWYHFDSIGRMLVNQKADGRWYGASGAAQTGWFTVGEDWYYAAAVDGLLYKGLHVINGAEYYFDETGVMQTGEVVADGKLITTNGSGAITSRTVMENGWKSYNGEWYYYQSGKPYTGWVGAYYVKDGKMVCNDIVVSNKNYYYVGEDGAYLTNAWIDDTYRKGYVKSDGTMVVSNWWNIDGKLYYFDWRGKLATNNSIHKLEKGVYQEDGAYLSPNGYEQGWILIDGTYYYKEGTNFVSNQSKKINGDWYLFDIHGKMVTGFSKEEKGEWQIYYNYDGGKFYYGADGRRCNYTGWQVIGGNWYYFNGAFEAASGWQIIGGVRYYFDTESHAMVTGYHVINKKLYYFDANGACQGVSGPQDGWYQADGNWYYIRGGRALTSERTVINNAWYEFDENGVWVTE